MLNASGWQFSLPYLKNSNSMKAKIWANFCVKDVNVTRQFYTKLGFRSNETNNYPGLTSFLFGDSDFVIHFFEQGSQIDEYLPGGPKTGEIMFTLSAETPEEVKDWKEKVLEAGGTISHEMGRDGTNHYGFAFADPDGHQLNILLM